MSKKKILFIGGSVNQSSMMYKISSHLSEYDLWFTPYYTDGFLEMVRKTGILDFSILGGNFLRDTMNFLKSKNLQIDYQGKRNKYDLVFSGADLIVPKNIRDTKFILVQEGMTDPENFAFYLVKYFGAPRWLASTSTMGMSNLYDLFCVASEGYKDLFVSKGADPSKIVVTGIPNFDNLEKFRKSDFPLKNFVLVATSDARETFKIENRKKIILNAVKIAAGRQLIFKLHPNENISRARKEIKKYAPNALVYHNIDITKLIANCDTLITQYSTVVYIGMALGKKVYSNYDIEQLKKLAPIQNGGASAEIIAAVAKSLLEEKNIRETSRFSPENISHSLCKAR